jgi:hypothetical protein
MLFWQIFGMLTLRVVSLASDRSVDEDDDVEEESLLQSGATRTEQFELFKITFSTSVFFFFAIKVNFSFCFQLLVSVYFRLQCAYQCD